MAAARTPPREAAAEAFAAAMGFIPDAPSAAALVGLEHEYSLSQHGRPLDFRDLIHWLDIPGRRLDPGDAHAYRLASGLALTCDEAEAELATPPLAVRPGFGGEVVAWAEAALDQLRDLLPASIAVDGFSTHLSASMPGQRGMPATELFARTFAIPLMLLLDGPEGHGLYLRPRPGRLEICAGYAAGERLAASAVLLAGGVRACESSMLGREGAKLPPRLALSLGPASGRFGFYVGRRSALGVDLYQCGRGAALPLEGGGWTTMHAQLEAASAAALAALGEDTGQADRAPVERFVQGDRRPLVTATPPAGRGVHPAGAILRPLRRPGFAVETLIATWDFTVFRLRGRGEAFACVPGGALERFLTGLASGALDEPVERHFDGPRGASRRLERFEQTRQPALWDEVGEGRALLPAELDASGRPLPAASIRSAKGRLGKAALLARPGKPIAALPSPAAVTPTPAAPPTPPPMAPLPAPQPRPSDGHQIWIPAVAAVVAAIIAVTTAAVGLLDGGGGATPTPTRTAATIAPATETPRPPTETATPRSSPTATPRPAEPTPTTVGAIPPTTVPTLTPTPAPSLTPTLVPTITPTPTPSPTPRPTSTPVPTSTPTASPTSSPTPTSTPTCPPPTAGAVVCTPTPRPTPAAQ